MDEQNKKSMDWIVLVSVIVIVLGVVFLALALDMEYLQTTSGVVCKI